MNKKIYLLLTVLLAWSFSLKAQTAEISQITTGVPGTLVTFDVTFTDIPTNVGAVSLFIGYDPNVLSFADKVLVDPEFASGGFINHLLASHQVGVQWSNPYGADINGLAFQLTFNYSFLGGSCDLVFGPGCEFTDIGLNPIGVTYVNGSIAADGSFPTITLDEVEATAGALSGTTGIGVTGSGFTENAGAVTLFIQFDKTVLQFTGFSSTLTAVAVNGNNTTGIIGVSYFNDVGQTLNTQFLTLNFMYDGTGPSDLVFTIGCEIARTNLSVIPVSYINGWVHPLGTSTTMTIPETVAAPGNVVEIPVIANGYNGDENDNLMGAITLFIGFDPAHLDFIGIIQNGSTTLSGASANLMGPGMIGIEWTNTSGALIDGTLLYLQFDYNFGTSALTFEGGSQVSNVGLQIYPTTFIDGSITPEEDGPMVSLPFKTGTIGQTIDFPVTATNFGTIDIAAISLFIGFDNSVLTYTSTTQGILLQSEYAVNYMGATSQIGLQWFKWPAITINDNDVLFTLHFTYNGGVCDVTFDAGCEFAQGDLTTAPVAFYDGGVIAGSYFNIKAFLQGPFNGTSMNTTLLSNSLLPGNQPYSGSPWLYNGTESISTFPVNMVDWVLLEIREVDGPASLADASTIVARKAALLLDDGSIVDLDGESDVFLPMNFTENVYIVVYHRNHVRVMSANALTMSGGVYSYDFTDAATKAYNSQHKEIATGIFGMFTADIDNDGFVFFSDLNLLILAYPTFVVYHNADFDLDGLVFFSDLNILILNYPTFTSIP